MQTTSISGAQYLNNGFHLIWKPGIRRFVFIPLIINLLLLSAATIYAFNQIALKIGALKNSDYSWVQWVVNNLEWLIWPVVVISTLLIVFFIFAFIANWIAAPFNGLLSEAVEKHLNNNNDEEDSFSWKLFIKEIPRLFAREFQKFKYYAPKALACLLLFFVLLWTPLFFIGSIIWFIFNAWMSAIQYIDYPMDNHKISFDEMLRIIRIKRSTPFGFGALVMLLTMIPLVNLIVMPVAVAGATNLWFDHYRNVK